VLPLVAAFRRAAAPPPPPLQRGNALPRQVTILERPAASRLEALTPTEHTGV
jgi:hypothetical protein